MSARVLHPAMMTEMSRNLGVIVASSGSAAAAAAATASNVVGRVAPSRAALARVRRDLFGPVDHAAARALAERELRAQSILDAERWGFDFRLEVPKSSGNSRFEWELITAQDVVPEPYALRGMPYLRRNSPPTPRKASIPRSPRICRMSAGLEESPTSRAASTATGTATTTMTMAATTTTTTTTTLEATAMVVTPNNKLQIQQEQSERTPPQETRVPAIGESTPDVVPAIADLSFRSKERKKTPKEQPTTPLLSRKQTSITDYMKSRKRTLNGSTKSVIEPPEKVARNAGQIRS